ncbi:family 16 glycosylhydrolase [Methylobacterium sp. NEAU K]|uniref:family 16 glycosylhydrolase n=1 Tax=Methylobacterium sp. NEAU K TaxID=3064946 RepID=UPI0027377608|nr:family 16 glycosylhydrolase [Methylobacterium sp. NEAU K]MDP4006252.1 family 16 glycosylhydrolase [Methylobacterium sp. NEAU K]
MTRRTGPIRGACLATALLLPASPLEAGDGLSPSSAPAAATRSGGSFVETFGSLGEHRWYVSDGWANGAHQKCTWSRQRVQIAAPGELTLTLSDIAYKDRAFSCAEIQTKERYGYGTYEVRMRAGAASGLVSAFFTYNGPEDGDRRTNDEIDFEFLGKDTRGVQLNYFTSGTGQHESFESLGFDASTTMADYALEWLPDRIRWSVNGRLLREVRAAPDRPIPSHPSKIILSIWSGQGQDFESWLGPANYPGRPITAAFERVAFTKLGDPCGFKGSIACR